ncbi:MAG: LytR/AlgR family response regulator transcription factor [Flavobacteriaceae bacterium]
MQTKKLRCILVDDSAIQRVAVGKLIARHPNLDLVAEYKDGYEAHKKIGAENIDLIFLDIEMPIINGFDFIESMVNPPKIVLITSKPEYAIRAFEYDVVDYLLKPITLDRFNASVQKVLARVIASKEVREDDENYIFVNSSLKKVKLVLNEINWIEGLGDYVKVVTEDANILVLSTMKAFLEKLPKDQFLRIHKSYIVNLNKIKQFSSGAVDVGGQQIPLSRHKKIELEEALTNTDF